LQELCAGKSPFILFDKGNDKYVADEFEFSSSIRDAKVHDAKLFDPNSEYKIFFVKENV
jgi:hypothetical protein